MKIKFKKGIKQGEEYIKEFTLRMPSAGEMRGLSMSSVMTMETDEMLKLIPRIISPGLTEQELSALPANDFLSMCGDVVTLLMGE